MSTTTCLLLAALSWPPPQMPTAEQFEQIKKMSAATRVLPSPTPPPSVFDDSLPTPVSETELKAAIERFKNAWFLGGEFFGKQPVEVDAFLLPNAEWTKVTYQWTNPKVAEPQTLDLRSPRAEIPLGGKDPLTRATAKVTIEVPAGFDELTIPCGGTAKPEAHGKMTFTLDKCDRDVFSVRIDGLEDDDRVVALDADKRALASDESTRGMLFGGKDISEITYDEFKKGPSATTRVEARARGTVAFVRWLRAKPGKKIELEVTALPEPKAEDYGPTSPVRFAPPQKSSPPLTDVDEKTLALKLESGRSCAVFGYNGPRIELGLPRAGNSLLAKVELAPPKVKGGTKGGFEVETNGLDARRFTYHWTLRPKTETKNDAPFSFATADVKATVRYPLHGETRRVDKPTEGVAIAGHKVTIKLNDGEELADSSDVQGIAAYDRTGRELKRFSYSESSEEGQSFLFMGQVASIRLNVISGWVEKAASAKLKPAPLRPKEKAGQCE